VNAMALELMDETTIEQRVEATMEYKNLKIEG
jgi:hypothetical protein